MSILPITLWGDKVLRKKTKKVTSIDSETLKLISDMYETMHNAEGMGLAANQVGSNKSVIIVDISMIKGFEKTKPMVFINPIIDSHSEEEITMEEGCLSIPDIRYEITRPGSITISFNDIKMQTLSIEVDDILARVIQHEIDHLNGIYFTDHVDEEAQKILKKSLNKIKNRKVDFDYPVTEKDS